MAKRRATTTSDDIKSYKYNSFNDELSLTIMCEPALSPDGWTSYAHMEQPKRRLSIMFQQCLMTLTGVPVATSSCTKTVYLMIKATRTHAFYLKPQPISSLDAMYTSFSS